MFARCTLPEARKEGAAPSQGQDAFASGTARETEEMRAVKVLRVSPARSAITIAGSGEKFR